MEARELLPEFGLCVAVLAGAIALGAARAEGVANQTPLSDPSAMASFAHSQRVAQRQAAAKAFYKARSCSLPRFIERTAPSDCPAVPTVVVSAEGAVSDLDKNANDAANMTDDEASTMWCGLVVGGNVTMDFSEEVALQSIVVQVADKDPKGRPTAKNPKLVIYDGHQRSEFQINESTGAQIAVPLAVRTAQIKLGVEVANGWAGQRFCVATLRAFGGSPRAGEGRTKVLGLTTR